MSAFTWQAPNIRIIYLYRLTIIGQAIMAAIENNKKYYVSIKVHKINIEKKRC